MANSNWDQIVRPYGFAGKKLLFEVLKDRYGKHEDIIDRITDVIHSEKDYKLLGQLIVDIYEKGFLNAVEQHRSVMEQQGLSVNVVIPKSPADNSKEQCQ